MVFTKLFERIRFYFQAKNAHGLHSPFAYRFYTEVKKKARKEVGIQQATPLFSRKQSRILRATLLFLNPQKVLLWAPENEEKLRESLEQLWPKGFEMQNRSENYEKNQSKYEVIFLSNTLLIKEKDLLKKCLPLISNNSLVIIPHIHASKFTLSRWKTCIQSKEIRVSMDLFFAGFVFFRKESTKENFLIRF